MKNKIIILFGILFLFSGNVFAQDNEETEFKYRFISGVGPMNPAEFDNIGIQINNSFEIQIKKRLILSANLHLGKSGNNKSSYTYYQYLPDFPEDVATNFNRTDNISSAMNSFSAVGIFALINPNSNDNANDKTRLFIGPGLCYMSWEEMTTVFYKGFDNYEFYKIYNRVRNNKKLDLGVRISIEQQIGKRLFTGLNFQGYMGEESASSISAIIGIYL